MDVTAASSPRPIPPVAWLVLALCGFAVTLIATAWMGDDAYITLRTLDNWVHGHGLRFNVDERVQAYTHPLWLFVLALPYAVTGEPYYTTLFVSMNLAFAAVLLVAWRGTAHARLGAALIVLLMFSKAFMDFSTSGLENSLTHLLLALWLLATGDDEKPARRLWAGSLLAGLLVVNRLDLLLLIGPPWVWSVLGLSKRGRLGAALVAVAPVMGWLGFALFYYGSPIPNTAFAKLGHGLGPVVMVLQGLAYARDSLLHDPVTLGTVLVALPMAFTRREGRAISLMIGAALYCAYVVWIGGDFMSGRFFTAPFFVAAWVLVQCDEEDESRVMGGVCLAAVLASVFCYPPPLLSGTAYGRDPEQVEHRDGIIDERAFYYPYTGLLVVRATGDPAAHYYAQQGVALAESGRSVVSLRAIGMRGYYGGPGVHIIDTCALADPLLARLPIDATDDWRIGHFVRALPEGYRESVELNVNLLSDSTLADYYTAVRTVTRGDLFDSQRLSAIWTFLRGPVHSTP